MNEFMLTEINTERCLLRPWRVEDIPLVPPLADTRDISWNTSFRFPYPYDEEAAKNMIHWSRDGAGENKWQFAVFSDEELAGGCGAIRGSGVETHTATVGYWLGTAWWGKGLATEIVAALVRYMREETDVEQLTASCFGWNPASRRVLEKTGFAHEGMRRGVVRKWGKTTDLWIYGRPL
ncbi:GNAT family N-acetyltransferase [Pseudodesulfovibrio thermohalotolerans]|uniref:GNAT family N-acetyltransferase n=1 Tax=Pseudodesulfovibrio thermohalotolerans TaxID=2880651 RepID=UPI002442F3E9|nr:GNAT family N-acetyltransferase [Pseudodesulfovibrio thermohalotolerans]WFS63525.1 GNAT family N-acetyltransferase [Pseudodesulfovibrio thermohalotolerans]